MPLCFKRNIKSLTYMFILLITFIYIISRFLDITTTFRPIVLFLYGSIGSGKSTIIKSVLKHLDINRFSDLCPCVFDAIRNVYLPGRYKKYHGKSKTC